MHGGSLMAGAPDGPLLLMSTKLLFLPLRHDRTLRLGNFGPVHGPADGQAV